MKLKFLFKRNVSMLLTVCMASCAVMMPVYADELADAQARKEELEAELEATQAEADELLANASDLESTIAEIDSQVSDIQSLISSYEAEASTIRAEVNSLQAQIDEKQIEIDEKQDSIDETQAEIEEKEAAIAEKEDDIAQKEDEIQEQYDYLAKRIQYMYENLDNLYIEAVFSTETIGESLTKVQYLNELNDYNQEMMDKLSTMKAELEEAKASLESDRVELVSAKEELEAEKNTLQEEQDALAADRDVVSAKLSEVEALEAAAQSQYSVISYMRSSAADNLGYIYGALAENEATEADIWVELNSAISEIEALTTQYEEQVQEGSSTTYSGGILCWPLPSEYGVDHISSWYGYRTHPVTGVTGSFHCGIDIWCPQGTPIYAAAAGVVVANQYDSSAGNWTVIYHGNGMYTEYMHQDYLGSVYVGQQVEAGQWIGAVGTTGSSTGYHLHIGVAFCYNGYFEGSGRVDPAPYLGIY